ncbi:MAG: hypothetical protein Q8S33_12695 [Myxococcales bacterium]|nr:hypothetical protein [Myxococcales bacterium]
MNARWAVALTALSWLSCSAGINGIPVSTGGGSGATAGGTSGAGVAGGEAAGGGTTAGGGTAEFDAGAVDAGPPCACSPQACLNDGGCADCVMDADCSGPTPVCDATRGRCVACRPTLDTCAANSWCSPEGACVRGCRQPSDCASGRCLPSHDCLTCQRDTECEATRVCGSGRCSAPCTTTCAGGLTCCGGRCVDARADPAHCGQCNVACGVDTFCGTSMCRPVVLSNVCSATEATAVLDGQPEDDAASAALVQALVSLCVPSPAATAPLPQLDAGVLSMVTGEPLLAGPMLCLGGGSFFQRSIGWLEAVNRAQVRDTSTPTQYRLSLRDGGVVATGPVSALGLTHDIVVIQLVRAPSGATLLNTAGFHSTGTSAGAWYFRNVLLPMRASLASSWYVVEWTDSSTNGPDATDTFTRLAP